MRYRNCIFDLYGTLVDIQTDEDAPELWTAMADDYTQRGAGYDPAGLRRAFRRAVGEAEREAVRRDVPGGYPEIRYELVFQRLFREKGMNAGRNEIIRIARRFRDLSTVSIRLYDGAAEMLKTLRARGCGVWLLSNAQSVFTAGELERLGLTPLFDGIYLSSDCGVKKPDRRFFDALLRERNIPPDGAVMTGNDGLCDIQGGKGAGLDTIYIRSNLSPDEPEPDADFVLAQMDLGRLLEILLQDSPANGKENGRWNN